MPGSSDTIAALATPVGTSAIAVVRASGPKCAELMREIFGEVARARVAHHADYRDRSGTVLDDVLVTFFVGPHSYSGEDTLEISCHGNPFIAQKILGDLLARGCQAAEPGEFTRRAFLNGRLDLSQAEAVMDLISARSERALAAANQQLRGSLGRHLATITEDLLAVLARVEAYIDFPEEDLPAEDLGVIQQLLDKVMQATDRLLATQRYGELLRDGIKTVIIGAPNAGKSSLLNRLVGRERALVSAEPGTTRDFIEERVIAGPHCIRLIDTAGLNHSPALLEKLGIEKTMERVDEADLFLLVVDGTQPWPVLPPELTGRFTEANTIVVINKTDLGDGKLFTQQYVAKEFVEISALTGAGIEALTAAIIRHAEALRRDHGDELIAINARHAAALEEARSALQSARDHLTSSGPIELLASDLRGALASVGEIGGKVDNERMLDQLFATFCIGK